jgi:hypothetical protein
VIRVDEKPPRGGSPLPQVKLGPSSPLASSREFPGNFDRGLFGPDPAFFAPIGESRKLDRPGPDRADAERRQQKWQRAIGGLPASVLVAPSPQGGRGARPGRRSRASVVRSGQHKAPPPNLAGILAGDMGHGVEQFEVGQTDFPPRKRD